MRKITRNYFAIDDRVEVEELFYTAANSLQEPAKRLLDIFYSAGCQSVVLEDEYVDMDFKAGHSRFYYLHHRDTRRRCKRAHFFSAPFKNSDLYFMSESLKASLLGYAVIRPLPSHVVGRTVINQTVLERMYPALYQGEKRYLTCSATHEINLAGNSVSFLGIPWMQQDKLIAACASAAIWTANWHLCHLYPQDFCRYTTPQITDLAVRFSMPTGRAMPSGGLTVEQMTSALKAMGYEPFLRNPRNAFEARRTIYHYIESGIPVIAIIAFPPSIQRHAITIVGHTLKMSSPTIEQYHLSLEDQEIYNRSNSDFVPRFIAQDDSVGPFRFLELLDWAEALKAAHVSEADVASFARDFACVIHLDQSNQSNHLLSPPAYPFLHPDLAFLHALLVPVPLRVTLDGTIAEMTAVQAIKKFWPVLDVSKLTFRTFLQPSNLLKAWWDPRSAGMGRPAEVAFGIRTHSLPSWVWITEFAEQDALAAEVTHVLGQIIQDSSGRGAAVDPGDDVIAMIGPNRVILIPPNPADRALETEQPLSEPIRQYRVREATVVK